MTLRDLERRDARGPVFLASSIPTLEALTIKFGTVTHVERGVFVTVSHVPSQGSAPSAHIGVSLFMPHTGMRMF